MSQNLLYNVRSTQVQNFATAGTATNNSSWVDTKNAQGIYFLARFGTAATQNFFQVALATATGGSASNLSTTILRNETDARIDVYRPTERYVRLRHVRGSSSTLGDTWAVLYGVSRRTSTATSQAGAFHASPTT